MIHFIVFPIPTVHLDDTGFVTIAIGIRSRSAKCFSPISGESLDMLWVKAMTERMGHDLVSHHPLMPGVTGHNFGHSEDGSRFALISDEAPSSYQSG